MEKGSISLSGDGSDLTVKDVRGKTFNLRYKYKK